MKNNIPAVFVSKLSDQSEYLITDNKGAIFHRHFISEVMVLLEDRYPNQLIEWDIQPYIP